MLFKKEKIRVFRTSSKKEPSKAYIGVPDAIKNNRRIPRLLVRQVEILPKPKTFLDLQKKPAITIS